MIPQPDGSFRTADGRYEIFKETTIGQEIVPPTGNWSIQSDWVIFDLYINDYAFAASNGSYDVYETFDEAADALDGYLNGGPLE